MGVHIRRNGPGIRAYGVATEDELKTLLEQMLDAVPDETTLIAQACLPGVVEIK